MLLSNAAGVIPNWFPETLYALENATTQHINQLFAFLQLAASARAYFHSSQTNHCDRSAFRDSVLLVDFAILMEVKAKSFAYKVDFSDFN